MREVTFSVTVVIMKQHPLHKYVEDTGNSIASIAAKAGCSRMTVYRVIDGSQNHTVRLLERISAATDGVVSVAELLPKNESAA